jgi:N-acyl homoserine lactone hydrolase
VANSDSITIDVLLEGVAIATDVGHPAFCAVVLIEGPDASGRTTRVLVDTAHVGRRPFLWDALAKRGLGPLDIDTVILTHAHWDHVQNVDVFAHAPIFMHADEYTYSLNPHLNDWATPAWTGAMFESLDIRTVTEGDEIMPGVGIVDMPGHSPGSIGVTVEQPGGLSVITGDALHFAEVAITKRNPLVFWDPEEAAHSIERVVDMADMMYPGHDQPFRVTAAGEVEYQYRPEITFLGISPDDEGITFQTGSVIPEPWEMPGIEEQRAAFAAFVKAQHDQTHAALEAGAEPDDLARRAEGDHDHHEGGQGH